MPIFVGDDWAEDHHDVCLEDEAGGVLQRRRVPEGVAGVAQFHSMVAEHVEDPSEVIIGIETDRGLFVDALVNAGYEVYAINPFSASRYRDRHSSSGAKSDPGDAKVLADLVRTDRHNHRQIAGDSELADAVKILARTHQNLIWSRSRQANNLRSTLREFYPAALDAFGEDLTSSDCLAILRVAPSPEQGLALSISNMQGALKHAGRKRNIASKADEIYEQLRSQHLQPRPLIATAFAVSVSASVEIITALNVQIAALEKELTAHFEKHPDAEILKSLPGLGMTLGARVLGEFGDDPSRYSDAKCRRNYAGTSPITRASGTKRAVLARVARNRRLSDACYLWAFASLQRSPGARALYDAHRAKGDSHHQALRALANRLVGILHGCLRHHCLYNESIAWPTKQERGKAA